MCATNLSAMNGDRATTTTSSINPAGGGRGNNSTPLLKILSTAATFCGAVHLLMYTRIPMVVIGGNDDIFSLLETHAKLLREVSIYIHDFILSSLVDCQKRRQSLGLV